MSRIMYPINWKQQPLIIARATESSETYDINYPKLLL